MASNISQIPASTHIAVKAGLQTAWRIENVRDLTYSEFLILLREGHIESVKYTCDMRTMMVTTTSTCPYRGKEQHTVGLIYDPSLYSQLCAHGVAVEFVPLPRLQAVQETITRTLIPIMLVALIIAWSLTLGRKVKGEDAVFGGARLRLVNDSRLSASFDDVAGIEDIKADIMEIVSFLQQKVRPFCEHTDGPTNCVPDGIASIVQDILKL
jgi:cell division protease FtsH